MSKNGISVVVVVSRVAFVVVVVVAVVVASIVALVVVVIIAISKVSYSIEDSKNFGMLKRTEKTNTGMRYLATRCFMALALFRFWNEKVASFTLFCLAQPGLVSC